MINDGVNAFPNSCVPYIKFGNWQIQQMYAYLRQREDVLQRAAKAEVREARKIAMRLRLEEVEAQLIYMSKVVINEKWNGVPLTEATRFKRGKSH